jgi:hypothetical protein
MRYQSRYSGRSFLHLLFLIVAAAVGSVFVSGCADEPPTEPGTDATPSFAPGGNTTVDLTLLIEAQSAAGPYAGPLYAVVYDEDSGLEVGVPYECGDPVTIDDVDYCSIPGHAADEVGSFPVVKGTKAVVIVPGSVPPGYPVFDDRLLPLQDVEYTGDYEPYDCTPSTPGDLSTSPCTIGASVTNDPQGQPPLGLVPLTYGTFRGGFDLKINNSTTVDLGAPSPSDVRGLDYANFGPDGTTGDSNDDNNGWQDYPVTTSTVMPLCRPQDLPASWPPFPGEGDGVWPSVAVAFFGAPVNESAQVYESEVWVPYPDIGSLEVTYNRACSDPYAYPGGLPLWVTELNFITQEVPGITSETQNTILETFEIRDALSTYGDEIPRFAKPLMCDLSTEHAKAGETWETYGDASDGVDLLPKFVSGYQASIDGSLALHLSKDAVAGWYTQYVTSSSNVTFTLKNTSADGAGTFNFSVTYACDPDSGSDASCREVSRQDNSAPSGFSAQVNFRNPPNDTLPDKTVLYSKDLVETTWSVVGLPYGIDDGGTVRYDVKTNGDKFPLAPGEGLVSGDWPLDYPMNGCQDNNNDGRWSL